ncbi:DUF4232 domain-containing protein [Streptomyces sp. NPDC000931]|uniref:DUF4232 domain-containing protein n=1 Tax=Streptomyces sp. NPDC000931 TaxID=3154372 RepID=UPI0033232D8A
MQRSGSPCRIPRLRRGPLGAVVLVTLTALTACGGEGVTTSASSPPGTSTGTVSAVTSSASADATPGPAAPSSSRNTPPVSPDPSGDAPRCTRDRLALSLGRVSPGAGNLYAPLVFTNKGTGACHLKGFPGVTLLDASGERIGAPAQRSGDMRPAVVLAPGESAYAALHTLNKGISDEPCRRPAASVQAYPPGSTWALRTPARAFQVCGGTFEVSAVRPGSHP